MIIWFLFGAMCMLVVLFILAYVKFISLDKKAQHAWKKLDHRLKYRAEFIPALSLFAASFAELGPSFQFTPAQEPPSDRHRLKDRVAYETHLTLALRQVFETAKKYPEVENDEHFRHLKASLLHLEKRILNNKKRYNSAAHIFNVVISIIPLNILANMFELEPYDYFDFSPTLPAD